ncbi:MAG TPA: 2-amino-4-hydroxy-6-hydroxymethyldihydropteridine diphosphokinase [Candidatus Kryptobacter bacterium]|nr:2-amino-4-hydroxy-6-hydroxymethyldihydropteridine diphosphokinase [Candidatus Kryptobacter bacterium]
MEGSESYLSLGSNLGDRLAYLRQAVESISGIPGVNLHRVSSVYETEPVGISDQPDFFNMAAAIRTQLEPLELLKNLKEIEGKMGRIHRERWREREIDIDIIFYEDRTINSAELTIPHASAHLRRFVLEPLAEIAPAFQHPVFHETVARLLDACADRSAVRRLQELTHPVS